MENKELSEGKKIRVARIIKGWTQTELAEHAGVSYTVVNEFENDKRKNIKPDNLKKIKDVLGIKD